MEDYQTKIALMQKDIGQIQKDIEEIKNSIKDLPLGFVSKTEFWPVKTIVYGLVGIILTAVVMAIVVLVIK